MGYFAGARDLRNLLAVAAKLRQLADDTLPSEDRTLYLTAAAALESRAQWIAGTLPQNRHEREGETDRHRPIDLII